MIRYVAFLKGINVGGQKMIKMEDLRSHFEMPGIQSISIYIQSGNVLFESAETDERKLQLAIEWQLSGKLGYSILVVVRTVNDIRDIVANNPFRNLRAEEERNLYVTFLSETPRAELKGSLGVYATDAEEARVVKREVYVVSNNYGRTCFSNAFIEKKAGVTATTRNWATVNKMVALHEQAVANTAAM